MGSFYRKMYTNSFSRRKISFFRCIKHRVYKNSFFSLHTFSCTSSVVTPVAIQNAFRSHSGNACMEQNSTSGLSCSSPSLETKIGDDSSKTKRKDPKNVALNSRSTPLYLPSEVKVRIFDKFGMPAALHHGGTSLKSLTDLFSLAPTPLLKEQLQAFLQKSRWQNLSAVQAKTIPILLQRYDSLCIAPTATGKTFIYLFSAMVQLVLSDMHLHRMSGTKISGSDVEELIQQKIQRGEICKYCELNIADNKICPMTGTMHPEIDEVQDLMKSKRTRLNRLEDLENEAAPRILVLVPTSTLVHQVYNTFKNLKEQFSLRYLVRASSAEEQRKHLDTLRGADILISTPETLLPALIKKKLSTAKIQVFIADEIDELVSNNHFEAMKMLLAALPKGMRRPQRMLFGASLPPAAYQMIRDRMLQPTHRFILCEKTGGDTMTPFVHPLSSSDAAVSAGAHTRGVLTCATIIAHAVFMVSQSEKIQKLLWLYRTEKVSCDQRTIIFCNSRHNAAYVADRLKAQIPALHVLTISSRSSDTAKIATWKLFHSGVSSCLVSTDILSRGMDFQNVINIVHYDVPQDITTWIHRSGRCGRSGNHGYTFTFFQPENIRVAKPLVSYLRANGQIIPPKLQEYARQSFLDVARNSIFHHPTRAYRPGDPQNHTPPLSRGARRYPDYRQDGINKHYRPH